MFSAFLQDEWKLSKRLNLSLGVRSEVNVFVGEKEARVTGEMQKELVAI